jgi:hypothetical protein
LRTTRTSQMKHLKYTRAPTCGRVAHLFGMKMVTPRAIAYVAMQVRVYFVHSASCVSLCPMLHPGMRMTVASAILCSTTTLWIILKSQLGWLPRPKHAICSHGGQGDFIYLLSFPSLFVYCSYLET